ncbi:MAG: NAD(P)-dependent oxidoreductase [Candidatus Latescibacteria bacterium]|jgi:nucleoside-diphosphate-sugar epimerase|nr:NAD(P)-dependent oxidoreductase [Candidatus Latescibacterota bacterium]
MKVLVVGGVGYIGGAITDLLLETSHEFRVYDVLLYEESYRKKVDFVYGDIRDRELLQKNLEWADAVIWLAALVGDGACALNPEITTVINQNSVEWLAKNFDGRIIFMSTCSVYGAQDGELDENCGLNPLSVYAVTKREAEKALDKKNSIIFRFGTLFGVGDQFSRIRMDLAVNTLTVRAFCQGQIKVFGGEQFRPMMHVKDAARVIIDNLTATHTGIFNVHRQNVRIIDLAYQVRNHFPDVEIEVTPMHFQDTRNYRVNSDKARNILNFKPQYSIDDGIEEVKELLETHRLKDVENPRYTNQVYLSMFKTHHFASGEIKK